QLATRNSWALPPFKAVVEAKYSMKMNCTLCHLQDSWELNHYGIGFLRGGLSLGAVEGMDNSDSDKDGTLTKDELNAGSNPGDPASTPSRPGNWLKNILPLKPPVKMLMEVFDEATAFAVLERPLTTNEVARLKTSTGVVSIEDADKYAVVFLAKRNDVVIGGACYVGVLEEGGRGPELNVFLLSVNPNGRILSLAPVHVHKKDLKQDVFLVRWKDRWSSELGTIEFPKKVNLKFAEAMRRQVAKYAAQVDVVIGP
ncbi:MAG: hypothetical protein HY547_01835, partial [Elusimicrobia bacterium]|nr:hypothetical protein [Elusimicrobiota bacterium]